MPSRKLDLSLLENSPAAIKAAILKYRDEKDNNARLHIVEAIAESLNKGVQIIVPYQDNGDYCVLEHDGKRYLEVYFFEEVSTIMSRNLKTRYCSTAEVIKKLYSDETISGIVIDPGTTGVGIYIEQGEIANATLANALNATPAGKTEETKKRDLIDSVVHDIETGGTVKFGRYPQAAAGTDETPIEWTVIKYRDRKAADEANALFFQARNHKPTKPSVTLISKYILDAQAFSEIPARRFKDSDLHEWLNGVFAEKAFNEVESSMMNAERVTLVESDFAREGTYAFDMISKCTPTGYAISQGLETDGDSGGFFWWLDYYNDSFAAYLNSDAGMGIETLWENYTGNDVVASDGSICKRDCNRKLGVRPVITLTLE